MTGSTEPLSELIERIHRQESEQTGANESLVRSGRVLQKLPGGPYLVDRGKGGEWMGAVTDELFRVDGEVLVIETENGPTIIGAVK